MRTLTAALGALLAGALILLAGCSSSPPPATTDVHDPASVAKPVGLDIPAIGVHVRGVTELTLDEHGAMQIPHEAGTVGWYPLGPAPGDVGSAVLTGHVSYNGPGVFGRLHELKKGDRITVPRGDGTTAAFEVYDVAEYPKASFPTDTVFGDRPSPELRLITCGGEFDPAHHTYLSNVVVSARLTT